MSKNLKTAYWSTVELYRTFIYEDGPFVLSVTANGGRLDAHMLAKIAVSYSVARTIPKARDTNEMENLEIFAGKILNLRSSWANKSLVARAAMCRTAAADLATQFSYVNGPKLNKNGNFRDRIQPHSAVTKFMWFVEPAGWTIFDSYAAKAILKNTGKVSDRQKRFYDQLAPELGKWSSMIKSPLGRLDTRLHPERLIDKYLLSCGMKPIVREAFIRKNSYFLELIPPDLRNHIEICARDIQGKLGNDLAEQIHE